jgi:hypothetical protein
MKFRINHIAILFTLVFAACQSGNNREKKITEPLVMEDSANTDNIENAVSEKTTTFLSETAFSNYVRANSTANINWNKFTLKGFWKEDFGNKNPFSPDKKYFSLYGPFLKYSPDSTMFIDLDSYNIRIFKDKYGHLIGEDGDADSEVSLVDLKSQLRKRLVFLGPGGSIEDAAWIDNDKFILIGYERSDSDTSTLAVMWKFDISSKTGYLYELEDSVMVKQLKDFSRKERLKGLVMQ